MKNFDDFPLDPLSITAELEHIGIEKDKMPDIDLMKIKENEEAFKLLLHAYKTSSRECDRLNAENKELKNEIIHLKIGNVEKKNAVVTLTIAEIITSIGLGGIFSSHILMSVLMILCGLSLTAYSLYLNFKK